MILKSFESKNENVRTLDVVSARIRGLDNSASVEVELYVVPKICSPLSEQTIELAQVTHEHLINLKMADFNNGSSDLKIDVLIGGNFYWKFMTGEVKSGNSGPVAMGTVLGWVLSGAFEEGRNSASTNFVQSHVLKITCESPVTLEIDRDKELLGYISKFWDSEEMGVDSPEDKTRALKKFEESIQFDGSHYSVRLPWKCNPEVLPDNFVVAKGRLKSLYRRLSSNPERLKEYDDIIRNQEAERIVETVDRNDVPQVGRVHYIPHREVIRDDKDTTKMRIVYDASAKKTGPSLNDCLETGPCLLPKIFNILVRFRSYKIAITSDIKSAFLNIRVDERDRDYLRFLWIDDIRKDEPEIVAKRFTSVIFGVNSSPFLLSATIETHMKKYLDVSQEFVETFLRDLYMDDSISGVHDFENGFDYYLFIKILMKEGRFELKKWTTNCASLLKKINEFESLYFGNSPEVKSENKVLGVTWNNNEDNLLFSLKDVIEAALNNDVVTKRIVLKTVSSIYDPLGLLSPAVVCFKLMFQEVCSLKCDWDFPLADEFKVRWRRLLLSLLNLDVILIPRHYLLHNDLTEIKDIEVHGF